MAGLIYSAKREDSDGKPKWRGSAHVKERLFARSHHLHDSEKDALADIKDQTTKRERKDQLPDGYKEPTNETKTL